MQIDLGDMEAEEEKQKENARAFLKVFGASSLGVFR